jgi:hypothetical protein
LSPSEQNMVTTWSGNCSAWQLATNFSATVPVFKVFEIDSGSSDGTSLTWSLEIETALNGDLQRHVRRQKMKSEYWLESTHQFALGFGTQRPKTAVAQFFWFCCPEPTWQYLKRIARYVPILNEMWADGSARLKRKAGTNRGDGSPLLK